MGFMSDREDWGRWSGKGLGIFECCKLCVEKAERDGKGVTTMCFEGTLGANGRGDKTMYTRKRFWGYSPQYCGQGSISRGGEDESDSSE